MTATSTGVPASDRSGGSTDRPWSGFRIDTNDDASGSWFGARKVGVTPGRVVYRIDPAAHPRPGAFGKPRRVARVAGPGEKRAAGPRATARAAWILSKYGSYDYEIQAAAVDAAVLHLLAGRDYALGGRETRARLRSTGEARRIKRFAAIMLRDSTSRSGPYRMAVRQLGEAVIGETVRLAVQIVSSRSGEPLTSVPVSLRLGSGAWRPAGETDSAGRVTFEYVGRAAGPQRVTARVARVPEHRLLLMQPRRASASRVAVAGRKHVQAARTTAAVKARPDASIASASITSGNRTRGSFRITDAYGSAPSSATVVLRGPFGSRDQATCQRKLLRVRQVPASGNGTYPLPRLEVRQAGVYIWYVVAPGDTYNLNASACAGVFRVRPRQ
ncbi:MAG: hypothetical protein M3237_07815 [Actinomycetota bacterium]|nr:hypothetical protein [Actinomycetota bacterium]